MTCYIVSFEPASGGSAEVIRERLKTFTAYCPINASCWAVKAEMTAKEVAEHVAVGSTGARIFVVRSGTAAAWQNAYGDKNSEWLKANL